MKNLLNKKDINSKIIRNNGTKIFSILITAVILSLLIVSGPAKAFVLGLNLADGDNNVIRGDEITFDATLDIEAMDEYLPITSLVLNIGSKTCAFNIDGEISRDAINYCDGITIEKKSGTYGGGYGYGSGYENGVGNENNFGYGYGYGYENGVGATSLVYQITLNTNYFSPETYTTFLKANIGGNTFQSPSKKITIGPNSNEEYVGIGEETVTLSPGTTEIVIVEADIGSLKEVIIPSATDSGTNVTLNLQPLMNNGKVTLGANDITLTRQGSSYNYSAIIPSGTVISGVGWDGKLILPTVKPASDYSVNDGDVDVVIDLGSGVELTFDKPVKVVLGGMAGKKAGWTRGTALTEITTVCNSPTNPTNINSVSPKECYIDDGDDLVIWTYHFTKFAAYTEDTDDVNPSNRGSRGCRTDWVCGDWTSCLNGEQVRICNKVDINCVANTAIPIEQRICSGNSDTNFGDLPVIDLTQNIDEIDTDGNSQNGFSRITGAVTGALGTTGAIVIIVFILGILILLVVINSVRIRQRRKFRRTGRVR